MPYTYKSLALLWLITFGLFALTGSGVVAGPWLLLLIAAMLAAPALIRLSAPPTLVPVRPVVHPIRLAAADDRERLEPEHEWGGAPGRRVSATSSAS
jgi:hypothetical protein